MPNTSLRRPQNGYRRGGGKKAYHGPRTRTLRRHHRRPRRGDITGRASGERTALAHQIDENMGFARYDAGRKREGWLVNVQSTSIDDPRVSGGGGRAASTATSSRRTGRRSRRPLSTSRTF